MDERVNRVQHRAKVDADGELQGFYPSDVWPTPPAGCVDLTDEQYFQWRDSKATLPHRYYRFIGGALVEYTPEATLANTEMA